MGAPGAFTGRRAGWSRRPAGGEGGVPAARARGAPIDVVTRDAFGCPCRERARAVGRARGRNERSRWGGSRFARAAGSSSPDADARAEDAPPSQKPIPFEVPAAPPALLRVPDPPRPIEPDDDDRTDEPVARGGGFSFSSFREKNPSAAKRRGVRARDIIGETARLTFRDFGSTAMFALVAGAAAQTINLGGTFVLAVAGVHEVELVAALFLVAVQLAKAAAQTAVRVATFRNARDVDCGDVSTTSRVNPRHAWAAVRSAFRTWNYVLLIDARRLLSIAWNGFLTIPIPYLALVKTCDYALCVPVFLFEGAQGKECLRRSQELMQGHKMRLLRAAVGLGALMTAAVGVVVGVFAAAVPSLPALLTAAPADASASSAAAEGATRSVGDAAMGIFTGTAFDRVWDVGSLAEKWATVALLAFAILGSSLFSTAVRQLLYVFYREIAARWTPLPPEEAVADGEGGPAPGPVRAFFRKMAFWKKVEEGDVSAAAAARTAELK